MQTGGQASTMTHLTQTSHPQSTVLFQGSDMADQAVTPHKLEEMSYKELQNIAMLLDLPANLKHPLLVRTIHARRAGREDIVSDIVDKYRDYRWQRRNQPRATEPGKKPGVRGRPRKTIAATPPTPAAAQRGAYPVPEMIANDVGALSNVKEPEHGHQGQTLLRALLATPSVSGFYKGTPASTLGVTPLPALHRRDSPSTGLQRQPSPPSTLGVTAHTPFLRLTTHSRALTATTTMEVVNNNNNVIRPTFYKESNNVITITNPQLPMSFYEMLGANQSVQRPSHAVPASSAPQQYNHPEPQSPMRLPWNFLNPPAAPPRSVWPPHPDDGNRVPVQPPPPDYTMAMADLEVASFMQQPNLLPQQNPPGEHPGYNQAHDLSMRKPVGHPVYLQNCYGQSFNPMPPPHHIESILPTLGPPSPPPEHKPPPIFQPQVARLVVRNPNSGPLARPLEYMLNFRPAYLSRQSALVIPTYGFRGAGMASTHTSHCYNTPLCSVIPTPPAESESTSSDLMLSDSEENAFDVSYWQDQPTPAAADSMDPQATNLFPDFRGQNNQISYPLIYKYLADAEQQMLESNSAAAQQRPLGASQGPKATSSPSMQQQQQWQQHQLQAQQQQQQQQQFQQQLHYQHRQNQQLIQPQPHIMSQQQHQQQLQHQQGQPQQPQNPMNVPHVDEATLTLLNDQNMNEGHVRSCCYFDNGCMQMLSASLAYHHERNCQFQTLRCPLNSCHWGGRLRCLASHVREAHRGEIMQGAERRHVFPAHKLRAQQSLHFVQESRRHLFVVALHCQCNTIYATIQFIPSPIRGGAKAKVRAPFSAKGSLEVVGADGHPRGWRGNVLPVQERVHTLWAAGHCLSFDLADINIIPGSEVSVHVMISG